MTIDDLIPDKELNLGGRPQEKEPDYSNKTAKTITIQPIGNKIQRKRKFADGTTHEEYIDDEDLETVTRDEEYWKELWNTHVYGIGLNIQELRKLCDDSGVFPITVRSKLDEHDIHETDWKEYLAHRPHLFGDPRLPEEWEQKTRGFIYSMSDTVEVENGEREPYYEELENPDDHRHRSISVGRGRTRNTQSGGAFSDLIDNA